MQGNNVVATAGTTHPACAACKHQRKRCTEGCILAPYFPAHRSREFQAVHKLFGVSNVTKIVKSLKEDDRKMAVDSLVWEASCRQKDPVLGPYGEYRKVSEELNMFRGQNQNQLMQLPGQWGSIGYKMAPAAAAGLMGWNGSNGINSKAFSIGGGVIGNILNTSSYCLDNGNNGTVDSIPYGNYPLNCEDRVLKHEKEVGSGGVPLQQNSITSGVDHQYYLPGNFQSLDSLCNLNTF
ncbi:LOB domain-containing protein 2 [Corylus avellana]|uniref:LOB domain-containing protein 2 n=1 Tax=Corylus avellana TaxID=13451 RepID=UPI001E217582|nr:LOB domain-containing protein 2 [Corylus avellana]